MINFKNNGINANLLCRHMSKALGYMYLMGLSYLKNISSCNLNTLEYAAGIKTVR